MTLIEAFPLVLVGSLVGWWLYGSFAGFIFGGGAAGFLLVVAVALAVRRGRKMSNASKPELRLMADYGAHGLWLDSGNVAPEALPLSEPLRASLAAWAQEYSAALNNEDPAASGFVSEAEEKAFDARGRELARKVHEELGDRYQVVFRNPPLTDRIVLQDETQ